MINVKEELIGLELTDQKTVTIPTEEWKKILKVLKIYHDRVNYENGVIDIALRHYLNHGEEEELFEEFYDANI